MRKRVLVTGGAGFIGSHHLAELPGPGRRDARVEALSLHHFYRAMAMYSRPRSSRPAMVPNQARN